MEYGTSKTSCLGSKFLLTNIKKEKPAITKSSALLRTFFKDFIAKEVQEKHYYDTKDLFFHKAGINIGFNYVKGAKTNEIVVRYDSEKERVCYLEYMPDTYTLKIDKKNTLFDHKDFIVKAITEMIPNGLQTDLFIKLDQTERVISTKKVRERWRYTNNFGLKLMLSIDNAVYTSTLTKSKEVINVLEILGDNPKENADKFNAFKKALLLENPTIIETHHSDLFIGLDYLLNIKIKKQF